MRLQSQDTETRDEEIAKQKSTTDTLWRLNHSFCETYFLPWFLWRVRGLVSKGVKTQI